MQTATYFDIDSGERETVFFYMLNAYLHARIDTQNESDGDEEVNVYMSHLLGSLVDGSFYVRNGDVLASTPVDVLHRIEADDSDRHKVNVYRGNADHRLIAFGLFDGWGEHRSVYRRNFTSNEAYLEEARQYYEWAALFSNRLPSKYNGLAVTLEKIATHFDTYLDILAHLGLHYFDLIERLTPGEMYHLERQAHLAALPQVAEHALDRMLDAYNAWKSKPTGEYERVFREECERYQEMNPEFEAYMLEACAA